MSRRGDAGRFTGNPETQGNATEEENSIERAFAAANGLDEVMMGGTQTPMPAKKGEFAGSPRQEAERTVLATRKKAQLTERLNRISDWGSINEGCAAGEMDQDLLTDEPVEGLAGYEELVCGDSSRMDKSWVKLIINTAVLMSYEPVIRQTWTQAVDEWTIVAPGHDLCQKAGENVNDLLARLRCSLVKLQKELRRLGKLDKLLDEEAMVRQHMLAVYSHTRYKMVNFMVVEGTRKEELTLEEELHLFKLELSYG